MARKNQEELIQTVQEENRINQEKIEEIRKSRNIGLEDEDEDKLQKREDELQGLLSEKKLL